MRSVINEPAYDKYNNKIAIVKLALGIDHYQSKPTVELLKCLWHNGANFDNLDDHNSNALHLVA